MLKIKDDINLQELEKFGFEFNEKENEYQYYVKSSWEKVAVNKYRNIYFELMKTSIYGAIVEDNLKVLFDLIQAGLVEKK